MVGAENEPFKKLLVVIAGELLAQRFEGVLKCESVGRVAAVKPSVKRRYCVVNAERIVRAVLLTRAEFRNIERSGERFSVNTALHDIAHGIDSKLLRALEIFFFYVLYLNNEGVLLYSVVGDDGYVLAKPRREHCALEGSLV